MSVAGFLTRYIGREDLMAKAMHLMVDHELEPYEVEDDLDAQHERLHNPPPPRKSRWGRKGNRD